MSVTDDVFQALISWLKLWHEFNIAPIFATDDVSQAPMATSNLRQQKNMNSMVTTDEVFHPEISALKAWHRKNIPVISVTDETSNAPMPRPEKEWQFSNIESI
mmetsp:Transcript_20355/g.60712  ORF Transcript_20355/g.60712 Transcript_20355/m.60712 type:complete len:103 (-) Transcript_20355:190-498(-)